MTVGIAGRAQAGRRTISGSLPASESIYLAETVEKLADDVG
jgi:hypothetical protein